MGPRRRLDFELDKASTVSLSINQIVDCQTAVRRAARRVLLSYAMGECTGEYCGGEGSAGGNSRRGRRGDARPRVLRIGGPGTAKYLEAPGRRRPAGFRIGQALSD